VEALLPFAILLLAFWLLIIRPSRTRARQQAQMQERLAPGTEVMTTSGLFATVVRVDDDAVVLEASPGVTTRWAKAAVARVLTPTDEAADDAPDDGSDDVGTDAESAAAPAPDPTPDQPTRRSE
jgi:preprotein translocase subunit YajC